MKNLNRKEENIVVIDSNFILLPFQFKIDYLSDIKLNLEKVNLSDEVYEIIDGNHANFGDYGKQKGDGEALISRELQQKQTVERIRVFIFNDSK